MKPRALISLLDVRRALPVHEYVKSTGGTCTVITFDAWKHFYEGIVNVLPIESFIGNNLQSSQYAELFCQNYLGHLHAVLGRTMRPELSDLFYPEFLNAINVIDTFDLILERYHLEFIIVNEDYTNTRRTLALWAKSRNIPSIHLTHAAFIANKHDFLVKRAETDIIAVFGQAGKTRFMEYSDFPEERIHVTGNPHWDFYYQIRPHKALYRSNVAQCYGLDIHKPILLFAVTSYSDNSSLFLDNLWVEKSLRMMFQSFTLVVKNSQAQLIIKDRPPGIYTRIIEIASEYQLAEGKDFFYANSHIEALIAASDITICPYSNVSIESMLLQVPSINIIEHMLESRSFQYEGGSGIIDVADADGIADSIFSILYSPSFLQSLHEKMDRMAPWYNIGHGDGQSTQRVLKSILSMVG